MRTQSFRMQDRSIALIPATWNPVLSGKPGTNSAKIARQFKNISYCCEPLSCVCPCSILCFIPLLSLLLFLAWTPMFLLNITWVNKHRDNWFALYHSLYSSDLFVICQRQMKQGPMNFDKMKECVLNGFLYIFVEEKERERERQRIKYTSFPYRTLMIPVFMLWNDERVLKKPHWLNGIVASFLM